MIKRKIKEYKSPHGYPGQLGQPKLVLDVGGGTSRMKTAGRRHASSIQSPRPLEGAGTGTQAAYIWRRDLVPLVAKATAQCPHHTTDIHQQKSNMRDNTLMTMLFLVCFLDL